jgi:hypothetical protein
MTRQSTQILPDRVFRHVLSLLTPLLLDCRRLRHRGGCAQALFSVLLYWGPWCQTMLKMERVPSYETVMSLGRSASLNEAETRQNQVCSTHVQSSGPQIRRRVV